MKFSFRGTVPASKSLLARAILCRSYGPLQFEGDSNCEDITNFKRAMTDLTDGRTANCGESGLGFRLLALRASRIAGTHRLSGHPRLFERPHATLAATLGQLGVRCTWDTKEPSLVVESSGWRRPEEPLVIERSRSSQFASSLLLNSWNLEFDLKVRWSGVPVSEPYWEMSVGVARHLGMRFEQSPEGFKVYAAQNLNHGSLKVEADLSSAFFVAAAATLGGRAEISDFPFASVQPDLAFVEILRAMGADLRTSHDTLYVDKADALRPTERNLRDCPDLFPGLSVLAAFAEGTTLLHGAPHLRFKESDRIEKTLSLVRALGRFAEVLTDGDGIRIEGKRGGNFPEAFEYDPGSDHRMAMAAGLAILAGAPIHVLRRNVVSKSFPEFWNYFEPDVVTGERSAP